MNALKLSSTPRWPQWLLVASLHLLLLFGLQLQRARLPEAASAEPPPLSLRWLPAAPPAAPGRHEPEPKRPVLPLSPHSPRITQQSHPPQQQPALPPATATATGTLLPDPSVADPAAATVPRPNTTPEPAGGRLLDSAATQRALREAAGRRLNQERFEANGGNSPSLSGSERLARQVARNAKGDCTKGEFLGGGMGLLSLPFYLAAEASGQCARGVAPQAASNEPAPLNDAQRAAHASMR